MTKKKVFCQRLASAIILSSFSPSLHPFWSSPNLCFAVVFAELTSCCVTHCFAIKGPILNPNTNKGAAPPQHSPTHLQTVFFKSFTLTTVKMLNTFALCKIPTFCNKAAHLRKKCLISKCMVWCTSLHTQIHLPQWLSVRVNHITHANQSICILFSQYLAHSARNIRCYIFNKTDEEER